MRSRPGGGIPPGRAAFSLAILAAALLAASGCMHGSRGASIPPLPAAQGRVNPGLGPKTKALSSGPGYKDSPAWSPGGSRVAFVVDGYVVDRLAGGGGSRRRTTRDFAASRVEWTGKNALSILGPVRGPDGSRSLYQASPGEGSLGVEKVATGVLAISPGPGAGDLLVAFWAGTKGSSSIARLRNGRVEQVYPGTIGGTVTALCASPSGRKVALAVRPPGGSRPSELRVFDLADGTNREVTRPDAGLGILGAPQWTDRGIYFVAGSGSSRRDGGEPLYNLYRAGPTPGPPEPAPGVGEGFVASSIRVSPDGGRLAVVGRLIPKSPTNLYVVNLATQRFKAVTTNEDMEINTDPDDLAWSPDGKSVAIVARGASAGEPEVRAAPADALLEDFYNLYEVPVGPAGGPTGGPASR